MPLWLDPYLYAAAPAQFPGVPTMSDPRQGLVLPPGDANLARSLLAAGAAPQAYALPPGEGNLARSLYAVPPAYAVPARPAPPGAFMPAGVPPAVPMPPGASLRGGPVVPQAPPPAPTRAAVPPAPAAPRAAPPPAGGGVPTPEDRGRARLAAEDEARQQRIDAELCGPLLRQWKFPRDEAGQRERFCRTFTNEIRALGDPDPTARKRAVALLDDLLKKAPCNNYRTPDPFYARCGSERRQEAELDVYLDWSRRCQKDSRCQKERAAYGERCRQARERLGPDDPRSPKFWARYENAAPGEIARVKEELRKQGWSIRDDEWYHPTKGAMGECQSLRDYWVAQGSNPRMWLGDKVEVGSAAAAAGGGGATEDCRLRPGLQLTDEFTRANLLNEDGSPKPLRDLVAKGVLTRDMVVCGPEPASPVPPETKYTLRPGVRLDLTEEQIDRYLKDEGGAWRTVGGRRMTENDILGQLLADGVLKESDVYVVGGSPRTMTATLTVPPRPPTQQDKEASIVTRVQGSALPYYGSFDPYGADSPYPPLGSVGGRPATAVGGVPAFPEEVAGEAEALEDPLAEDAPSVGATRLAELRVSFANGTESWPAFP